MQGVQGTSYKERGSKVQGAGFKGCDVKCKAPGLRCREPGAGYRVTGAGYQVQGTVGAMRRPDCLGPSRMLFREPGTRFRERDTRCAVYGISRKFTAAVFEVQGTEAGIGV